MYKTVLAEVPGSVPHTQSSQPSGTPVLGDLMFSPAAAGSAFTLVHCMHAGKTLRKVNESLLFKKF